MILALHFIHTAAVLYSLQMAIKFYYYYYFRMNAFGQSFQSFGSSIINITMEEIDYFSRGLGKHIRKQWHLKKIFWSDKLGHQKADKKNLNHV